MSDLMSIVLIFPPLTYPRTPYLGLPSLAAFLQQHGYRAHIIDANLDLFYSYFSKLNKDNVISCLLDDNDWKFSDAVSTMHDNQITNQEKLNSKKILDYAYNTIFKEIEVFCEEEAISNWGLRSVDIRDIFNDDGIKIVLSKIFNKQPIIIGFSLLFPSQIVPAISLANLIREQGFKGHITLGGPQVVKLNATLSLDSHIYEIIDSVILYEGEEPLLSLARALSGDGRLNNVPNLIYKKKGTVVRNDLIKPIHINDLPTPDFKDIDFPLYLSNEQTVPFMATRGCYWDKCAFCTYKDMHRFNVERKTPKTVVKQIRELLRLYPCRLIRIIDDALPPKVCRELSSQIIEEGVNVRWNCSARFEKSFTADLCKQMADAGCNRIIFGLESYNQRVLDLMNKGVDVNDILPILKNFHQVGIKCHLSCIIGFPSETIEEAINTERFLIDNADIYDTCGVQPFNLEEGTIIDKAPHSFGIRSVLRDKKMTRGVRFGYRFEIDEGMNWEEAGAMAKRIQAKVKRWDAQLSLNENITEKNLRKSLINNELLGSEDAS